MAATFDQRPPDPVVVFWAALRESAVRAEAQGWRVQAAVTVTHQSPMGVVETHTWGWRTAGKRAGENVQQRVGE